MLIRIFREIKGLKKIHKRLSSLPVARRACPSSINKDSVLSSVKRIITEHANDQPPKHINMPTIIHYHHEEPPAKIRAVEIPRPKVHPLVLIRLPSDVESVKHKIPRSVEPDNGKTVVFYILISFLGESEIHHGLPEEVWLNIFKFLSTRDKCRVGSTCRTFNRFVCSRQLWRQVNLCHLPSLSAGTLRWLLRRAPESLTLPTCVSYRSLVWLLSRSPMLRKLQIHGASWNAVSAINTQQVKAWLILLILFSSNSISGTNFAFT